MSRLKTSDDALKESFPSKGTEIDTLFTSIASGKRMSKRRSHSVCETYKVRPCAFEYPICNQLFPKPDSDGSGDNVMFSYTNANENESAFIEVILNNGGVRASNRCFEDAN
jgi:hypothetical protein